MVHVLLVLDFQVEVLNFQVCARVNSLQNLLEWETECWTRHVCLQPKEEKCDVKSLKRLEDWTWQFVILRPALSILVIFLEWTGWYVGAISWTVTIILNLSVSLAMYSLVLFYHLFHTELAPHKPLAKILCIKGVVFFSFWQVIKISTHRP